MAQWGNSGDTAANSVLWGVVPYNGAPNTTNQTAFFNNSTEDAFVTNLVVGQYGASPSEVTTSNGRIDIITITDSGSGYTANASTSFAGGGGTSAAATATAATGKITSFNISDRGSSYETNPSITIAAPTANSFNANSAVTAGAGGGANSVITIASAAAFVAGDPVTYSVAAGNTAVGGLVSGTKYYIQFGNATVVALATTPTGSRITLTKGFTETGHTLQGDTATATPIVGGGANKGIPHAGWVVRKVGTGGRAGRVQYETLVAMGSLNEDASDDTVLPDSTT
jgi:hypothetical protein